MATDKIVVSLFDYTGEMVKPWVEAGYEAHIFDRQHPHFEHRREDGIWTYNTDLVECPYHELLKIGERGEVVFMSMFPPCTHVAISGARWFRGKGLRALEESVAYFATCVEAADYFECPYMIENPMSTISTYWREPDHKFHPFEYGGYIEDSEDYTKETWLWTGNGFTVPPRKRAGDLFEMPDNTYIHYQSPGEERANIRSATPKGFAKAVYEANKPAKIPARVVP